MKGFAVTSRLALAIGMIAAGSTMANAQTATAEGESANQQRVSDAEIIVTARKRDETLISVPVVVTAIGASTLSARGITNLDGIARITPQLIIGNQGGAIQGGNISIRGIAGADQNPFGDQAVSFNIDGVQVGKATVRRMSEFDIGQVEVLKGPQALFFGKNSPAGIISIRTADPTDYFEAKATAGYEFEARQIRLDGYVSTPLSDTLGLRIAGGYSGMRGDIKDVTPANANGFGPDDKYNSHYKDWAIRGTLKWAPSDTFDAKLKLSYGKLDGDGPASGTAFTSCPTGNRFTSFLGGTITQCSAQDGANSNAGYGTVVATLPATLNHFRADGENFNKQKQFLGGLQMNLQASDKLSLTSVTGYYSTQIDQCQNYENDPIVILPSCNIYDNKEFSQELRFQTDLGGIVDFTGGVYFADTKSYTGSLTYLFATTLPLLGANSSIYPGSGAGSVDDPALINQYTFRQKGQTYSAYGQVSIKPIPEVEVNLGGRYTKEKKRLPSVRTGGGLSDFTGGPNFVGEVPILDASTEVPASILPVRNVSFNDFSPEATISYRPTSQMTLFGSYKRGFLSGGFNSGSVTFNPPTGTLDLTYKPQRVKGFEAGIKVETLGNALRLNLAAYTYKITDQQVTVVFNATNAVTNAGGSSVKGVEFDFNYRTPLDGLSIYGAVSYNKGKYTQYADAPCYGGQTVALGCIGGKQDLGNTELIRAPEWNASAGFDYLAPLTDAVRLGLSAGMNFSDSYLTDASSAPNGRQPSYTLFDASARLVGNDDAWELAVIGRNLSDRRYVVATSLVPFAFNPTGAGGGLLDRFGTISRGREVMLRASFKFGGR